MYPRLLPIIIALFAGMQLFAQDAGQGPQEEKIFVFLDCKTRACDFDHFRREIPWVNWINVQEDADVHLLITAQQTGGNGWQYTLDMIGRGQFDGEDKTSTYVSDRNNTDTERRDGLTSAIERALFHYVEGTAVVEQLEIVHSAPSAGGGLQQAEQDDPWNLWVFRISADGSVEAEAGQDEYGIGGRASADRVTEAFKIGLDFFGEYESRSFDLDNGGSYTDISEDYTVMGRAVWSLSEHWSAGLRASGNRSTFYNRDLSLAVGPAIEYNFFPYSESTRRSTTLQYVIESASFDYTETTVENKDSELLARHSLTLAAAVQQPWGEIFGSVEGIQYLNDPTTHRINTFFNIEYRLFRGFTLDLRGGFARIKDQFYLAAEGNTLEEILLQRQQRETSWEYDVRFGITYQFGSKFANIVNPRMGGGSRRFFF